MAEPRREAAQTHPSAKRLSARVSKTILKHPWISACAILLLTLAAGFFSATHLDISTETDRLFSSSLEWKKRNTHAEKLFAGEKDTLVAVISGKTPEEARRAAHGLKLELDKDPEHFASVAEPASNPYYLDHALLFLPAGQLEKLLDSLTAAQPFLATLSQDPSARGLFGTFGLIALGIEHHQPVPASFMAAFSGLAKNLDADAKERFAPLSWQNLLSPDLSALGPAYEFVVTHPKRDFNSFQPSAGATKAMKAALARVPEIRDRRAEARITGEAKINDEEFATVADGMVSGLVLSLALVTVWLVWAVRSPRIVLPVLITLVAGLVLTTGFAALAVGTLNLISVAFAILFVGIAVDFAIQYSVRFRSQQEPDGSPARRHEALETTTRECGGQILVAALATCAGFLAFTPTKFVGVAQLGLIAGVGMIIAFACTLTLLPALLLVFRARPAQAARGLHFLAPVGDFLQRRRRFVLAAFGVLGAFGLALLPLVKFDSDPLHTKNPNTEGMQALKWLESSPLTTPYNAQYLTHSRQDAAEKARAFSSLSSVHDVLWLGAIVPEDQKTKLAEIRETADILLPTLNRKPVPAPTPEEIRQSAAQAYGRLAALGPALQGPLKEIAEALGKLARAPDETLVKTSGALTRFLPDELGQLRSALTPSPAGLKDVPADIAGEYLLHTAEENDVYRLVIHPKGDMTHPETLRHFVAQLKGVSPDIVGPALEITESTATITHAFLIAAGSAIVMIFIILLIALRRILDAVMVLTPLLLSSLLTAILIVLLPEPLNYANIIALPLLLGVGVSFNIYFVMNWRRGQNSPLTSPTARAVLFSALTTGSAFGSLALSNHPGTASMGQLLLISLACTLLCTLIFIPALLPAKRPHEIIRG